MNSKQQKLADKCANIHPLEGRLLIVANKMRTYKDKGFESEPTDPDIKPEDVIPGETEMTLKEVITDVNYRYQTGVIVQVPITAANDLATPFYVGDTVIFELGALKDFDLVKGVSILRKYDVIGLLRD